MSTCVGRVLHRSATVCWDGVPGTPSAQADAPRRAQVWPPLVKNALCRCGKGRSGGLVAMRLSAFYMEIINLSGLRGTRRILADAGLCPECRPSSLAR